MVERHNHHRTNAGFLPTAQGERAFPWVGHVFGRNCRAVLANDPASKSFHEFLKTDLGNIGSSARAALKAVFDACCLPVKDHNNGAVGPHNRADLIDGLLQGIAQIIRLNNRVCD